jgi:hypothetical protein
MKPNPPPTPANRAKEDREARLAEALRENLKRRKQGQNRRSNEPAPQKPAPDDEA